MRGRFMIDQAKPERGELIAALDGWELRARPSGNAWMSFVLVSSATVVEKRKFWGGYNSERLSRSYDLNILNEHHRRSTNGSNERLERREANAPCKP